MPAPVTVPTAPPLARVNNVPLMHAGSWDALYGPVTFTPDDFAAAVGALDCPAVRRPVLKFGHDGKHGAGLPALGYIDNLGTAESGQVLVGDYAGVPGWLASTDGNGQSVLSSAYPDRSIEGEWDYRCQLGHLHPFVVHAVALLGVERPGIGTLPSLTDLADLYGAALATPEPTGVPVAVTVRAPTEDPMPKPRTTLTAATVSVEDVRRDYYAEAPWSHWITEVHLDPPQLIVCDDDTGKRYRVLVEVTGADDFTFGDPVEVVIRYEDKPAAVAAAAGPVRYASRAESRPQIRPPAAATEPAPVDEPAPDAPIPPHPIEGAPPSPHAPAAEPAPPTEPEEDPVSTSLSDTLRSRLGLPDDADDAAVAAAVMAELDKQATANAPRPPDEPDPQPDPEPDPAPEPAADRDAELVSAAALGQEVRLLKEQVTSMSAQLAASNAEKAAAVKASVLNDAQRAGKFRPADRPTWEANYDKAPDVATSVLASIAPGTAVPVQASGVTGPGEPAEDESRYDSLFTRKATV